MNSTVYSVQIIIKFSLVPFQIHLFIEIFPLEEVNFKQLSYIFFHIIHILRIYEYMLVINIFDYDIMVVLLVQIYYQLLRRNVRLKQDPCYYLWSAAHFDKTSQGPRF